MGNLFGQSKALFTEQLEWYTAQLKTAGQTFVADAEKATRGAQQAWNEMSERQVALAVELGQQSQAFIEKQMKLIEQAFTPAA